MDQPNVAPVDVLTNHLASKRLLMILDNCEHLIEACARLADRLLRDCPNVHLLTTSRELLCIAGEVNWRVPSLSASESVRLFVERARAVCPDFELTDHNTAVVAQICQQLDGIPLAIELAAARSSLLSVEQIAARLSDRFHLLTGGSRAALPRHKTLRASIDWSYGLLTEAEQTMLRRLSVFAGGWTLEAAEAVVCDEESAMSLRTPLRIPRNNVLDVLTQLINKSLVIVERRSAMQARYRLLETIRQYAYDKLLECGEVEQIRDQHLKCFLRLAERAGQIKSSGRIGWRQSWTTSVPRWRGRWKVIARSRSGCGWWRR
jgi:predicted ATPase